MISRNIKVFRLYYMLWRFKPLATLMLVYFAQITSSFANAMGVFSVLSICCAVSKIPSGIISDKIGRKPVILLGSALLALSFILLAFSGQYNVGWLLFAYALLAGVSEAMISGTTDALMFETMEELHQTENFKILYSKSMLSDQLGCAIGALSAMSITYYFPLQVVAWFATVPVVLQFFVSFYFVEPKQIRKKYRQENFKVMAVFRHFIKNKKLMFYTTADIFFSTLGDVSHRFESVYFKLFASDWVISLARVLKHVMGMIGFAIVPYIKKIKSDKIYWLSIVCNVLVRSVAVWANNIFSPFIHMFINFFYATASTAKTDILQSEFLPQYRASSQSVIMFVKSIYMALVMYLIGVVADMWGILSAMYLLIIVRVFGLVVAYFCSRYKN